MVTRQLSRLRTPRHRSPKPRYVVRRTRVTRHAARIPARASAPQKKLPLLSKARFTVRTEGLHLPVWPFFCTLCTDGAGRQGHQQRLCQQKETQASTHTAASRDRRKQIENEERDTALTAMSLSSSIFDVQPCGQEFTLLQQVPPQREPRRVPPPRELPRPRALPEQREHSQLPP